MVRRKKVMFLKITALLMDPSDNVLFSDEAGVVHVFFPPIILHAK